MNNEIKKLKMQECYKIVQNSNTGTLCLCDNGMPYATVINYDTDCYCCNLILYFNVCKCGEAIDIISNNENACILVNNRYGNCRDSVLLEGTLDILEDEVDCCCNQEEKCSVSLKFTPCKITGRRYQRSCSSNR